MLRPLILLFVLAWSASAGPPVYVVLWFDTEDYIEPASDDAALRIAQELTNLGVRAVFKIVGEKARVLERRGRRDVIAALAQHEIGYHTGWHSVPPAPSVYLRGFGMTDGEAEFERRERPGFDDVSRIFGHIWVTCYGQPGSSWAPQATAALRRLNIPVYLDEGEQVGVNSQPFWYEHVLHIFNLGRFAFRASLDPKEPVAESLARFDKLAAELAARGGGVISTYYHPTEFVTTEFWDAVNFSHGAGPDPRDWKRPKLRTKEDSERCYRVLVEYVKHALATPGVRFATALDLRGAYGPSFDPPRIDRARIAAHMAARQTFLETPEGALSASEMLQMLLGIERPVLSDGPPTRGETTFRGGTIPRAKFERARREAAAAITGGRSLPAVVWIDSNTLSLGEFAATLAADDGVSPAVTVRRANLEFEKYFATDGRSTFGWVIHPQGFDGSALLELGRLQGWTLKPARLR